MVCLIQPQPNLDTKSLGAYYNFGISKGQVTFVHVQYSIIINYMVIAFVDFKSACLRLLLTPVIFSSIQPFECRSVRLNPSSDANISPSNDLAAVKLLGGDPAPLPLVELRW